MTQSTIKRPAAPSAAAPSSEIAGPSAKADLRGKSLTEQDAALKPESQPESEHGHDEAREPAPAGATGAGPVRHDGDVVPADVRDPLITALKALPASAEVLDAIDKAGKASFPMKWSDAGTFHSAGTIYLRASSTEATWLASLAHELVHLQTFVEGKAANAQKQGRDEFVKAKMDDEINAQVTAFIAILQSGSETGTAAGFDEFVAFVKAQHAAEFQAKKWSELRPVAWSWIEAKYENEWVTNNTQENYYDYWGNSWDKANGQP